MKNQKISINSQKTNVDSKLWQRIPGWWCYSSGQIEEFDQNIYNVLMNLVKWSALQRKELEIESIHITSSIYLFSQVTLAPNLLSPHHCAGNKIFT